MAILGFLFFYKRENPIGFLRLGNPLGYYRNYLKQHRCGIFVAEKLGMKKEVQRTETIIGKPFRCNAPFVFVSMNGYKYFALLLLWVVLPIGFNNIFEFH